MKQWYEQQDETIKVWFEKLSQYVCLVKQLRNFILYYSDHSEKWIAEKYRAS